MHNVVTVLVRYHMCSVCEETACFVMVLYIMPLLPSQSVQDWMAEAVGEHANTIALAIQGSLTTVGNKLKSKGLLGDEDYGRIVYQATPPPASKG